MIFITISSGSTLFSAIPGPESHPNSPALHLPFGNVVWVAKADKWTPRNVFHIPASLCCMPTSHCVSAVRQGKAIPFRISQYLQNAPATPSSLGTWWRRKPEASEIWYWQKVFFFQFFIFCFRYKQMKGAVIASRYKLWFVDLFPMVKLQLDVKASTNTATVLLYQ